MARWLRQSTSTDVPIGPFVDQSDGFTPETTLTITQPDIRLKKNGGAWAQKNAAQTLSHEENGNYEVTLDATDTNTLGLLRLHVNESGALPIWEDFIVVPANVYDSFFSTDLLQVDLTQWLGSAPNALVSSRVDASVGSATAEAVSMIRSVAWGTADSGSTTTMVDAARTETGTDYWKGCLIVFGGSLTGQTRLITGFDPTTDTITFAPATTAAVSVQNYEILPAARVDLHSWLGSVANALISGRVDANTQAIGNDVINAAAIAAGAIDDDAVAADMNAYHAKVWVVRESTTADHYAVVFFKNGQPVTSGITSPTIQVIKASDGTDLIASGALTEVGALGIYRKDESTNKMTAGAIYFAKVTATIDGSTREWLQQVGRDSV